MTNKKIIPQLLKGFRDFYPEDMAFQTWFYQNIKQVSESFGFQEYEGPTIETLDLYAAKSGEELVKKQAFTLKDQSGKILALRPELTPTLARMVAQKAGSLTFPVKWFSYGRRFRYEKPQRGRGREFNQWDIDILGPENLEADAEIICVAAAFYQKVGLTPNEVKIKINDREFLQEKLTSINIPKEKALKIFKIIDKKGKVKKEIFEEMLNDEGLAGDQIIKLLKILEDKDAYKESFWLSGIFAIVKNMGFADFIEFEPCVVRGLDYYTRTVFEGWDQKGEFRSIWGGGRYDDLTAEVGGKVRIPGVGFAMGDMIVEEVLKANSKYPLLKVNAAKVLVTIFSKELENESLRIANELRKGGINTEIYLEPEAKLDKQLKYADKKGVPYVIILGPDEVKKGGFIIKNMATKTQKFFSNTQSLSEFIK